MLDIKFVRDNPELVLQNLKNRNNPMNLDRFMELEKQRREIIAETENLKSQKNAVSKKISEMKKNKENWYLLEVIGENAIVLKKKQENSKIQEYKSIKFEDIDRIIIDESNRKEVPLLEKIREQTLKNIKREIEG